MTTRLLDANAMIASPDPAHVQHHVAHEWFVQRGQKARAICAPTENGVLRILGNGRYPNSPGSAAAVTESMAALRVLPGQAFRPDDISLLDPTA